VRRRLVGQALHAPAHVDAEVLSALGRLTRARALEEDEAGMMLAQLSAAPIARHPVERVLLGAWSRRHALRLADALYVELAVTKGLRLVTTDRRLRTVAAADVIAG